MLASLPRLLLLRRAERGGRDLLDQLVTLTVDEARRNTAGGRSVRLRLSELMFIELLRRYAAAPDPKPPGWLAGLEDAGVGRALAALHARPDHGWTVAGLARDAALSRSALAERFARLVGMPPLRYLRLWRMQIAAGLLADGVLPVAEVARRVGYASEEGFSRGFKRLAGVPPEDWRRGAR